MGDYLMAYRPLSEMLRLFVIPEIEHRVTTGMVQADKLPFQVHRFRYVHGGGKNIVEINDEVTIKAQVRITRPVAAGESLTLADIHPDDCFLEPPEVDGKPAAFFLCHSLFLNFITMFDFTPNLPPELEDSERAPNRIRYPVADLVQASSIADAIKPIEKYAQLAAATWPPGPGLYPHVLWRVHQTPHVLEKPEFADAVAAAHSEAYWKERLAFWTETAFFGDRMKYVEKSIGAYLAGDYVASIYILVPHIEGIVFDYVSASGGPPRYRLESRVADLKKLVLSRKVLMFPRKVLDQVFDFIETGTFLTETGNVTDPSQQVTRHGISHGVFKNFENRDISLKYLILLDALAYVVLHDKLLTGKL